MTTTTTCDYCGNTIDRNDLVKVEVVDYHLPKMSYVGSTVIDQSLSTRLDLHRQCYANTLLPEITDTKRETG